MPKNLINGLFFRKDWEDRTIQAADEVLKEGIARIILIGDPERSIKSQILPG